VTAVLAKGKDIAEIQAQLVLWTVGKVLSRHLMGSSYGVAGGKSRNCDPLFIPPAVKGVLIDSAIGSYVSSDLLYCYFASEFCY